MQQLYPDEGLGNTLAKILVHDLTMKLFVNNIVPDLFTTVADLVEATFAGYAAVTISAGAWSAPAVAGHVASSTQSPVQFLNSSGSPQSAYGYYIVDEFGHLFAVALFDTAPLIRQDGEAFVILPICGDFSASL